MTDYMQVAQMVRGNSDFDEAAANAGWEDGADLLDDQFDIDEHEFIAEAYFMLDSYTPAGKITKVSNFLVNGDITVLNTMGSEYESNRWYPCEYVLFTDENGVLFIESDGSF